MLSSIRSYVRQHHVALLALVMAVPGSAYAGSQLHGNNLVDRSVPREKLRINTLTGREIHEPALKVFQNLERAEKQSAVNSNSAKEVFVSCPDGKFAVGGGGTVISEAETTVAPSEVALTATGPTGSGLASNFRMWYARAVETDNTGANWSLHAEVLCARIPE